MLTKADFAKLPKWKKDRLGQTRMAGKMQLFASVVSVTSKFFTWRSSDCKLRQTLVFIRPLSLLYFSLRIGRLLANVCSHLVRNHDYLLCICLVFFGPFKFEKGTQLLTFPLHRRTSKRSTAFSERRGFAHLEPKFRAPETR